jgi:trimeric autotransporter adhesin
MISPTIFSRKMSSFSPIALRIFYFDKTMKNIFFLMTIGVSIFASKTFAQSITLTPNTQSMIDANSTTQGVLFPRMNSLQRTGIISPSNGLLVYDTDTNGFWYSQNGIWTELPKSSLWSINGLAGNEIRNTNAGGFWSSNPTLLPFIDDNGLSQTAPTSGSGTRLMWISSRSAFRCGTVNGDAWDAANVGLHSFASGYNSRAIGLGCIAFGTNAISDGTSNSIAFGENTRAIGNNGLAMGYGARVNAQYGVAIGNNSLADGTSNTIALGEVANASGTNGVAIGTGCHANSYYSVAMGYYNSIPIANATSWVPTDPLFTIGNGQSSVVRSNAFLMLKNGKTAIGNTTPQSFLHVFEGESGTSPNSNSMATFEKNGIGYITLLTPEANENGISFGLPSNNVSGGIYYNSAGSKGLQFRTGGNSTKMYILSNGNVGIGVSPSAKLEVNGDLILGTNGTAINEIIKVTVNANLASIAAVSTISRNFTVTNAALGSTVYISPDAELPDGIVIANARVSAANTVTVKFTNATTVALNPATMDYHITVIR